MGQGCPENRPLQLGKGRKMGDRMGKLGRQRCAVGLPSKSGDQGTLLNRGCWVG